MVRQYPINLSCRVSNLQADFLKKNNLTIRDVLDDYISNNVNVSKLLRDKENRLLDEISVLGKELSDLKKELEEVREQINQIGDEGD